MKPVSEALRLLFEPGDVVECRIIRKEGMASGYYDDFRTLSKDVAKLDSNPDTQGIYITLNTVNPALLSRRANRMELRLGKKDATTSDSDIVKRRWFPIDIDPVRPSGVSSSADEKRGATWLSGLIKAFLAEMGWSEPIEGDSGNGAHLLYRIDLPNDTESRDLVKRCFEVLHTFFSGRTDGGQHPCDVDCSNFNAARIWKLYGTMTRKGDDTADRPHRRAALISAPEVLEVVTVEQLRILAEMIPTVPEPKKSRTGGANPPSLDLAEWLNRNGIGYDEKPFSGGRLFVLDECPFSGGVHKDGAYCIQFSSGAIFAGCHHNTCGSGQQRWPDLRRIYEGEKKPNLDERFREFQKEKARRRSGECDYDHTATRSGECDSNHTDITLTEARRILTEGDPLRYVLDTYALDHEGDEVVAECLALSLASRSIANPESKGLHVSVTGESGKGKSHSFETMLNQVPDRYRVGNRLSDKALFYADNLRPGMVIPLDDTALSDQMQEILKGVTTSFQKPFVYQTVNKDRRGQVCSIPERCVWWVAKVEGVGDDQVWNRMLTVWIDDSEEQDARVLTRTLAGASRLPAGPTAIRDEILVCRAIWDMLFSPVWVVIPYANRIRFHSAANRRNPDMLLDLIRANVILRQYQRKRQEINDTVCITATDEDFRRASRLYQLLNGETGGQASKLTRRESEMIASIQKLRLHEFTIPQLQQATGLSHSSISRMLHGYMSRGNHYSGLLEKCPAISFTDRTVSDAGEGMSVQRRARAYSWDPRLYASWASGGGCWIESSGADGATDDNSGDGPAGDGVDVQHDQQICNSCSLSEDDEIATDYEKTKNSTNNFLVSCKDSNHVPAAVSSESSSSTVEVAASAAHQESIRPPRPPIPSPAPICGRSGVQQLQPTADHDATRQGRRPVDLADGGREQHDRPAAGVILSPSAVDPTDFKKLDLWEKKPCSCCGRSPSDYQERMTRERMAGPPRENRMLCSRCYQEAVKRKSRSITTLPGSINVSGMWRWSVSVGRCHVCDSGPIVWYDPEMHTGLCETCYQRENQRAESSGVECK